MQKGAVMLGVVLSGGFLYFFYRVYYLYNLLKLAQPENRYDHIGLRIRSAINKGILQLCHFKIKDLDINYSGIMHMLLFFGFIILLIGEIELIIKGFAPHFSYAFLGNFLYGIYLFLEDLFTILVFIAILMSLIRRFTWHPKKENYHFSAYFILALITILIITLIYMGMMNVAKDNKMSSWMFVATFFYNTFHPQYSSVGYRIAYWVHIIVLMGFLDYIPDSKHLHILAGIPNNFFINLNETMNLRNIDFEDENAETFGVAKVEELTWKEIFDGYACTECGRCSSLCPAANTGKILIPKEVILTPKKNLFKNVEVIVKKNEDKRIPLFKKYEIDLPKTTYGEYKVSIPEKALFQCTTCGACQTVCPVSNEHIRNMIEMKRYLVMTEGRFPEKLIPIFNNLETNFNPWGINLDYRTDWAKDLDVPTIDENPNPDVLYFVGCAASFDDRNKAVARAFVKIMQKANVNFAILGRNEKCCGDSARRLGNEYLFYNLAIENIENFRLHKIKKIVTACPHGYYTLKNEYLKFGGDFFEVVHHTQFIHNLINDGKLKLDSKVEEKIVYHDSCYLGRHSNLYDTPRDILLKMGADLIEVENSKKKSFCCGAGGGMMWLEEEGERINHVRSKELLNTQSDIIATACPFCMIMIDDGVKDLSNEHTIVKDIAQIVENDVVN